jgi:hypothetical protein
MRRASRVVSTASSVAAARTASRRLWAVVAAAALLVAAFVLARLALTTSVGGFALAGDRFADPAAVPAGFGVQPGSGYDGQFVYRLALDPWTTEPRGYGIALDLPAYRQQRVATAALAWVLAGLPGISTALALILVNAVALVVAAAYGGRLAVEAGRHPAWGLVLAFPACMPISLARDLTEPVAWAGVLAGLLYCRRRHSREREGSQRERTTWASAAVALTIAVLARETSLLIVAGLLAGELLTARRARARAPVAVPAPWTPPDGAPNADRVDPPTVRGWWPAAGWLAVPLLAAAGWQLWLWHVWGELPARSGPRNNLGGVPVLGVLDSVLTGLVRITGPHADNPAVGALFAVERLALLLAFGFAAVALLRGWSRVTPGERIGWGLTVALALWLTGWAYDVQFLRATYEALGMSVLVALFVQDPAGSRRMATLVLAASGGLTAVVAVMYVLVP